MKFKILRYYLPLALTSCIALIIVGFVFQEKLDWKLNITLVASIISSIYFVEKQKIEQMEAFIKIFTECNKRYGMLNEKLNEILCEDEQKELSSPQIDLLYDYFNLCAEEYLFFWGRIHISRSMEVMAQRHADLLCKQKNNRNLAKRRTKRFLLWI